MYETAKETLMYRTGLWTLWEREKKKKKRLILPLYKGPNSRTPKAVLSPILKQLFTKIYVTVLLLLFSC